MTREIIDAIPTGKAFGNLGVLIPGVQAMTSSGVPTQDVGGSTRPMWLALTIHGSRPGDQGLQVDGMPVYIMEVNGAATHMPFADGNVEETNLETAAHSAELDGGGVRVNVVPKSGGNTFRGSLFGTYTNEGLQSNNLDDDLKASGLLAVNRVDYIADVNPAIGGPIAKDRLWFHGGYRNLPTVLTTTNFFDSDPRDWCIPRI